MVANIERKPLEYFLSLKYPVSIEEAPEGGYFIRKFVNTP